MDMSSDNDWEKLIMWETRDPRPSLLVRLVCGKGSLTAIGVIRELSEDELIISLDNHGELKISLVDVDIDDGDADILLVSRLPSPIIYEHVILRFRANDGGFCDLSEMPANRDEWPDVILDLNDLSH